MLEHWGWLAVVVAGVVAAVAWPALLGAIKAAKGPTHTSLTIEYKYRPLLEHSGYGDVGQAVLDKFERLQEERGAMPEGPAREELQAKHHAMTPPEQWGFVFFGLPGTGDTVVWSDQAKTFVPDQTLLFDRPWRHVLKGGPFAEKEPYLVVQLGESKDRPVYRVYLKTQGALALGGGKVAAVLCCLPVALLSQPGPKQAEALARDFDLRVVPNIVEDYFQDAFGEYQLVYTEGHDLSAIYENDLFRFEIMHFGGGA